MTGRPSSPDSAGQIMRWRQWVQPLQTARDGKLPISQERLSALHPLVGDENDKAFRAALLAAAKDIHSTLKDDLAAEFEQGRDGAVYVGRHSLGMDQLLEALLSVIMARHGNAGLALVAVGGYGRGELAPLSDIDLLVLTAAESDPAADVIVEQLLYLLWDLGLKVGHAKRTVTDTIRSSREDHTILTGLIEMRFIGGDAALYRKLETAFQKELGRIRPGDFAEIKLAERDARHQKHGATR